MGFLEPHGRHRRRHGQAVIRPIVIHGLGDALAALAAARSMGQRIDLITAPAASAYIGPGMFKAVTTQVRAGADDAVGAMLYDCGPWRGHVLAGLRVGLTEFCLDAEAACPALSRLIAEHGATLQPRPADCFDPGTAGERLKDLSLWLNANQIS